MFHSSVPVAGELFHNRRQELERLLALVRSLQTKAPSWLAILGQRKVGKTSLLMELARVANRPSVRFLLLDVLEAAPPSLEVFRVYALRALDRVLGKDLGVSLERLAHRPPDFRSALSRSSSFLSLPAAMRAEILEISERDMDSSALRFCLDLPEQLARALDLHMLVAIDEFQELASLSSGRRAPDLIPLIRSVWQKHNRVGYVISGSARSVITRLITDRHSPFFQHFALMELGPFSREDAISLLVERSPRGPRYPLALLQPRPTLWAAIPSIFSFSGRSWWPSHHPWTEPPSRGLCRNCFSRGMDVSPSFSTTSFTVWSADPPIWPLRFRLWPKGRND